MGPLTDDEQGQAGSEPPRPAATFFTLLFTIALFVNMWADSQSAEYNGVQNSVILATLALAPPGVRVGASLVTVLAKLLDRTGGDPK